MTLRRQLIAAGIVAATIASTASAAVAADGSKTPAGPGKGGIGVTKPVLPSKGKIGTPPNFAEAARLLGVTTEQLQAAFQAAKMSMHDSDKPTIDWFVQHVAASLGLPVARVESALVTTGIIDKPGTGDSGPGPKKGMPDKVPAAPSGQDQTKQDQAKQALAGA